MTTGASTSGRTRACGSALLEALEGRVLMASNDVILHWNEILLQSLASQPPRVPIGRNLALVQVAVFDAVNAIDRSYQSYYAHVPASRGASEEAAAAQAAHDTLRGCFRTVARNAATA